MLRVAPAQHESLLHDIPPLPSAGQVVQRGLNNIPIMEF